ncbi:hypothetical protein [Croceivirga sp. JEA036]|uniref:hypothetical protein n=1 Tax=Croceivirga sp. JEA036 TaxID=2721162 RepID=UPI00143B49F7|nr:hypothetical protein [Croceivirga sp. JEA036]NJB37019.1 hypothetical protein [Croceivirga sp. JEA036]
MKNRLSKLILCSAALSFTLSCDKEITVEQEEQQVEHSHVETGGFLDYPELSNILEGLDIKNANGKYFTEKNGKEQEIKIDSSEVSRYKNKSVETYTLRVETKKNAKEKGILENLVLRKDPEGYSGFILRYHLTKDYLKELRDNRRAAMRAYISMERVNVQSLSAKQTCTYVTVPTCDNPGFDGDGAYVGSNGEHIRTDRCTNSSYFTTETFSVCTDSGDDCNGCYYFDGTVTGGDPTMTGGSTGITSTPASEYDEDVVVTQPSGFQNMFVSLAETINGKLGNSLSPEELSFLVAFYDFALEVNQFFGLPENQTESGNSIESIEYINDLLDAVLDNSFVSTFPFVKYPEDKAAQYKSDYPKLTEYLMNQLPKLVDNPTIVNAFKKYTNATTEQVEQILKWGDGPEIVIKQLGESSGHFQEPNTLELDIDLVNFLENAQLGSDFSEKVLFAGAATIVHEAVHFGDFTYNNDFYRGNNPCTNEEGWLFEQEVYDTAIEVGSNGSLTIHSLPLNCN